MDGTVIELILAALPQIKLEDGKLDREAGIDRSRGYIELDEKTVARSLMGNRFENELEKELLGCDPDELLKTEALMYYGRDQNEATIDAKLAYFRRLNEPADEIVRTLLEKRNAFQGYIEKAKEKLAREGLTIDAV